MNQTIHRVALLLAALAAPVAAQNSAESLAVSAGARFQVLSYEAASSGFRPTVSAGRPKLDEGAAAGSASAFEPVSFSPASAAALADDIELAPLLNSHLKTRIGYQLGGRTVWFSGAFDAADHVYVSILVDGYGPMYFQVLALVHNDQPITFAGQKFTLSLSPNYFHNMRSTIELKNDGNSRETARFTVQNMVEAVSAVGHPVVVSGKTYNFYYADAVGQGLFVFICGSSDDPHESVIPVNRVPTDRLGIFTLFGGKRVGLMRRGTSLQIYDNP